MIVVNYVVVLILGFILGVNPTGADEAAIRQNVGSVRPDVKLDQITASPIPGVYEVQSGREVYYISADGKYILHGNLFELASGKNLTETKLAQTRKLEMDKVPETSMVVFAPEQVKHTITVFTDIDCGYCRKLHKEINDYLKAGIKVRYLLYPRAGVGSDSYIKSVSVWCAKDRQKALTDAKNDQAIPQLICDNPVQEHMRIGEVMGVTGTPSMVTEDGRMLPGYLPAAQMSMYLDGSQR